MAGLPWGLNFNPHTHPIPIPMGIPMGIPIPTAALDLCLRYIHVSAVLGEELECFCLVSLCYVPISSCQAIWYWS